MLQPKIGGLNLWADWGCNWISPTRFLEAQATFEVGSLPTLYVKPSQMKQLFQNLIANAIKYHKKDELPVITICSQKDDLELWRITVKDNGIGFDEKYRTRFSSHFNDCTEEVSMEE